MNIPSRPDIISIRKYEYGLPRQKKCGVTIFYKNRDSIDLNGFGPFPHTYGYSTGFLYHTTPFDEYEDPNLFSKHHVILDLVTKTKLTLSTPEHCRFTAFIENKIRYIQIHLPLLTNDYTVKFEDFLNCNQCPYYNDMLLTEKCCKLKPLNPVYYKLETEVGI